MIDLKTPYVVAEAGTCHAAPTQAERQRLAHNYVDLAVDAGVDAIKFQMFADPNPKTMFCWMEGDEERAPRWHESAMLLDQWQDIQGHCEERGIDFIVSTFENQTVDWLNKLHVSATKVASRAAARFPYHKTQGLVLISDGMLLPKMWPNGAIRVQCEANYPSMKWWSDHASVFSLEPEGFSDHSGTPWRAIDAMARGCKIIEVHFYLNPDDAGPDLEASLSPAQLAIVCEARDAFSRKVIK